MNRHGQLTTKNTKKTVWNGLSGPMDFPDMHTLLNTLNSSVLPCEPLCPLWLKGIS